MDAEDLFIYSVYIRFYQETKGVVHTCAGYMIYTCYSFVNVFQYKEKQIHFLYSRHRLDYRTQLHWFTDPFAGATTSFMKNPNLAWIRGRLWDIIDKYQVKHTVYCPNCYKEFDEFW